MRLETRRLCDLVVDETVYPRAVVDDVHVQDLFYAHQAGAKFPRMIVEGSTNRVVDGVHRRLVYIRVLGAEADIEVEIRDYANDGELLLDAARLNSDMKRKLARSDQVLVLIRARALGVSDEQVAVALSIPPERISTLEVRIAVGPTGEGVALKRNSAFLGGREVTAEQIRGIRNQRGSYYVSVAVELVDSLEREVVNLEDGRLCRAFHRLASVILERVPVTETAQVA